MRHIDGDTLLQHLQEAFGRVADWDSKHADQSLVGWLHAFTHALESGDIGNLTADCGDAAPSGRPPFLEPGTVAAQDCGCTCPPQTAAPWKGYRRALDCPLHSPVRGL